MTHIIALAFFLGLVLFAGALTIIRTNERDEDRRKRYTTLFILYVIGACLTAGLTMRDLWPFAGWRLMTAPPPSAVGPDLPFSWFYGVTPDGREHPIDYRAWEPVWAPDLAAWFANRLKDVSEEQRERVGAMLLAKANAGRAAAAEGRDPGHLRRFLGPFRASSHLLLRGHWEDQDRVPAEEFVALRWYVETWDIEARAADTSLVERVLGFEYP